MERMIARGGGALLCTAALAWAGRSASAQEQTYAQKGIPAPTNALELKVGTEYTQGFGMIAPGQSIGDTAGPGFGVHVDADYRAAPAWSLGLQGEYQEFATERDTAARGFVGNLGVTAHLAPYVRGDPWLRLATGYRFLWQVDPPGAPTTLLHGFELAKATIGYDIRVSREVALAPQVGGDVNLFVWREQNGTNTALSTAQWGTFVFAGLQGRFDAGGTSAGGATIVARDAP